MPVEHEVLRPLSDRYGVSAISSSDKNRNTNLKLPAGRMGRIKETREYWGVRRQGHHHEAVAHLYAVKGLIEHGVHGSGEFVHEPEISILLVS